MAQAKGGWAEFLKTHVEQFSGRLADFQREADRLAAELSKRGHAQVHELEQLILRLEKTPWVNRSAEFTERAKGFGGELASHLEDLQGKMVNFVGVATRDQVAALSQELKQLARKIEGLSKGPQKTKAKRGK